MQELEARVLRLETTRAPSAPRQVGDYFPDPGLDPTSALIAIRVILAEMLPPSGIPSPAQRLLLRIKDVVEGPSSVVSNTKGREE